MSTPVEMNDPLVEKDLFVKMVLNAWDTQNSRVTKLLDTLSDEQFMGETAPGRNRGIYLIGHLIVVSDRLLPLLGLSDSIYPQFESIFLTNPDRSSAEMPSMSELRKCWSTINTKLSNLLKTLSSDEWFMRHTAVSAEDFLKDPTRNKLNVIINRTNHTSTHLGQLNYLVKKQ